MTQVTKLISCIIDKEKYDIKVSTRRLGFNKH